VRFSTHAARLLLDITPEIKVCHLPPRSIRWPFDILSYTLSSGVSRLRTSGTLS
jgi:hypothetical protein